MLKACLAHVFAFKRADTALARRHSFRGSISTFEFAGLSLWTEF